MHMRTTLNLDDTMVKEATKLTGIHEKTSLIHLGLQALIARERNRRNPSTDFDARCALSGG